MPHRPVMSAPASRRKPSLGHIVDVIEESAPKAPPTRPTTSRSKLATASGTTVEEAVQERLVRNGGEKASMRKRQANSADVRRRREAMNSIVWESNQLARNVEGARLTGSKVPLPQFGIDLVVDSQAKDFCPPVKEANSDGTGSKPTSRPSTAVAKRYTRPPTAPKRPFSGNVHTASPPVTEVQNVEKCKKQLEAFDVVPEAVMKATPYLQFLREQAEEKAQMTADASISAATADHFEEFHTAVSECVGAVTPEVEDSVHHAFELFVTTGDMVGVRHLLQEIAKKSSSAHPSQTSGNDAKEAEEMDDLPPPSGMGADPWSAQPKLRMSVSNKKKHLKNLLKRSEARASHPEPVYAAENAPAYSPRNDVVQRSKAHSVLNEFKLFHAQQKDLANLRRDDRHSKYTANLYRKHSAKLQRPLLERRTINEDELCGELVADEL